MIMYVLRPECIGGQDRENEAQQINANIRPQILVDSLPYIRDFNQKIIIISFGCSNILTDEEEQEVMRDIALMKSIGMRPIVVHDTKMGHDKFRENKRIAKMIEFCGV